MTATCEACNRPRPLQLCVGCGVKICRTCSDGSQTERLCGHCLQTALRTLEAVQGVAPGMATPGMR